MRKAFISLLALICCIQCVSAQNVEPTLIPFQGRLTDQAGAIVPDGSQTIIFNLYDVAVGSTAIWTERHENVGVIDGMVNVFLGSIEPIPEREADGDAEPSNDPLFFAETKYLGITVDDPTTGQDIEMIPRQVILPAFHARSADSLNGYDWSSLLESGNNPTIGKILGSKIQEGGITSVQIGNGSIREVDLESGAVSGGSGGTIADGSITQIDLSASLSNAIVPIGTILPYAGVASTVPTGWELCNGAELLVSEYAELFAVIGTAWGSTDSTNFSLPDMRGRVPVGMTDADTVDRLNATIDDGDGDTSNDLLVIDSQVLGAVGGEDMHQLTEGELARHRHGALQRINLDYGNIDHGTGAGTRTNNGTDPELDLTGGDLPHNNIQPTAIVNYIIRTK